MKQLLLNSLFLLCSLVIATAQPSSENGGELYRWVSQKHLNKEITKSPLFEASSFRYNDVSEISEALNDYQILNLNTEKVAQLENGNAKNIQITVPFDRREMEIQLSEIQITSDDYTVKDATGTLQTSVAGKHYRGIIGNDPNSLVAISIIDGQVYGILADDSGNYNLGMLEDGTENYILYKSDDMVPNLSNECHADDSYMTGSGTPLIFDASEKTIGDVCNKVRLYWEADNGLFTNKGSIAATEAYLLAIFNQMAALYQNDGIIAELSGTLIWNTADPYGDSDSGEALDDFKAAWNAVGNTFNGDLAHLVALDPGGLGGLAYLNVLCNRNNAYGYSDINSSYSDIPTFSWTIEVLAHEIGHNMASPHTHACAWNGNSTRIDNCGGHAGYTEGSCADIPVEPVGGGTIMSYCHLTGTGINFNNGFHSQVKTLIHTRINDCTSLQPTMAISTTATDICAPSTGAIDLTVAGGTAGYGYSWLPGGSSSEDLAGITAAATYSVTVTDANSCIAIVSQAVSVLPTPGTGAPSALQNVSGTGNLSISATGTTLGTDEVLGWWITKTNPISSSVSDQASLDAATGAANIQPTNDGSAINTNPSVLFKNADISGGLAYNCSNMESGATYYATPVVSASRDFVADANCVVGNGGVGSIGFNGFPGKFTSIAPGTVSCRPNPIYSLPTYTLNVIVTGYTGPAGELSIVVRDNNFNGTTIISDWFNTGDGTYSYTHNQVSNYSPNDPGDPGWTTGLTAIAWHQGGNGMQNGSISLSLDITYPGQAAIPFPSISYNDCVFGDPVPFQCATACVAPNSIPSTAGTYTATSECTDGNNWTHYWDNVNGTDGDGDDLLLLSIKKNGNDIGTVGVGAFDLKIGVDNNGGSAINIPSSVPYVINTNGWYVMDRYWEVTPTTQPASDVAVRFYYNTNDYQDVANVPGVSAAVHEDLVFYKTIGAINPDPGTGHTGYTSAQMLLYANEGTDWTYIGGAFHTAELLSVPSFSGGGGGASDCIGCGPLPIELLSFNGRLKQSQVFLNWATSTEINNDFFTLEHSTDGINFEFLTRKEGAGTVAETQQYKHIHENPAIGGNYYRLSQTDFDGTTKRAGNIVFVEYAKDGEISVYPNPATSILHVQLGLGNNHFTNYEIYDALGRKVSTGAVPTMEVDEAFTLDIVEFSTGLYLLKLTDGKTHQVAQFIKN